MRRRSGFSLVELIVMLTISAILAALAIPYFAQSEIDASWFHDQVVAALRYAQRQAVAQRRPMFVVVGATTVDLCYDAACATRLQRMETGAPYSLAAPSGVTLSPPTTFSFNSRGQSSPAAGVSFAVSGQAISVTGETGYVQ